MRWTGSAAVTAWSFLPLTLLLVAAFAQQSFCQQPKAPPGMAYIPGGTATLGITSEQAGKLAKESGLHSSLLETPQRKVEVKGFFLDCFEVTNAQYALFLRATGHVPPRSWTGWRRGRREIPAGTENLPVTDVRIADAKAYAKWAGKRLPTEAEWEWAARGSEGRLYPWGDEWVKGAANLMESGLYGPAPVGSFPKDVTAQGVFDMAGNVSEWTDSTYGRQGQGARVWIIRGGNWMFNRPVNAAAFVRKHSSYEINMFPRVGFRCALDVDAPAPREVPLPGRSKPAPNIQNKRAFEPPAGKLGPIDIRPTAHLPHRIEFLVPGMTDQALGLQLPENVRYRGGHFATHALRDIQWTRTANPTALSCHVSRPQDGYEYWASATVRDRRVDIVFRFKNISKKPLMDVIPTFCLGCSQYDYRLIDPEHERVVMLTPAGVRSFCQMPLGKTDRPLFRWIWVKADRKDDPSYDAAPCAGVIGMARRDRKWTYVKVFEGAESVGSNGEYSCIHSEARWNGEFGAGQERTVRGSIFFLPMPPEQALPKAWREFQESRKAPASSDP